MTVLAFLLFVLSIPLAMALGARHQNPIPAVQSLAGLSMLSAVTIGVLLRHDVGWLAVELVLLIGLIAFVAPMMFGFGAWRTPELNDSMDESFNRLVEPYLGHPVDVFGWAHRVYDLLPAKLVGSRVRDHAKQEREAEPGVGEDG